MIAHAACGAITALAARFLLPGHSPESYLLPAVLGAAGGIAADWLGRRARLYQPGQPASWAMSVLGSMALLLVYGVIGH